MSKRMFEKISFESFKKSFEGFPNEVVEKIYNEVKLPNFIKSALKPFYNANEVVLSTILISVDEETLVKKVQSIATSNKIFVIDFKDIVTED